jgi:hypothetical protein
VVDWLYVLHHVGKSAASKKNRTLKIQSSPFLVLSDVLYDHPSNGAAAMAGIAELPKHEDEQIC